MERVERIVIGAGVVGLAVARALALAGREVVILEAAEAFGTETSARNSEVIHAGLYYPRNSLKARLCVRGKGQLYAYLAERGIPHARCEKLIVATSAGGAAEIDGLRAVQARAAEAGVDLPLLSAAEAMALEPDGLDCVAALHSPTTGIVDSHGLMLSLLGDAEAHGAMLAVKAPVLGGRVTDDGLELAVGGAEPMRLRADGVINCAGHGAPTVSRALAGVPVDPIPPQYYAKGCYFALTGRAPFRRLVYPVPGQAGLGIHYTIDLGGQGRFGPDVTWTDGIDYTVDADRATVFADSIRRYWPGLPDNALHPSYAGVRPKIQAPGEAARDFLIQSPRETGVPGYSALYGIESPGLTSCLAIADMVGEWAA
ncbi:NAD(P)/FAD-dependent oxidoreductase [Roseospira marina]|uniref:NAD(P)/FAD-dependent oxidoreductase n=1 Tax=Roseospira marina TaxID=140057 RepID=UPI00160B7E6B|nr:NAD(P)/FAD-dependent oxidoreductase [Roseospira marina]MBB4312278.1 L-2-hydroxyglutarate oxidase LhgO [Roseospira marina]MBB5085706.1 L-2-hydroxyglutarate oxidase LhgO [Roseospira marina]